MKKYSIPPSKFLYAYIDRYWDWESSGKEEISLPKVLPGTGVELVFHYRDASFRGEHLAQTIKTPRCHITHLKRSPFQLFPAKDIGFLSVRFRGGAFRHFSPYPAAEVLDTFISAEDIWGPTGAELSQRIAEADNLQHRIFLLEHYLTEFLLRFRRTEPRIDYAIHRLYYSASTLRPQDIAEELALSPRQFQRLIREAIGMGPKNFCLLTRFQQTVRELLLRKETDYLAIALDAGYFDQSHFIKEFKRFTQETPSSFLQEGNFMSHFYNTTGSFHCTKPSQVGW
jgi:AraC-like DNA-binding protein